VSVVRRKGVEYEVIRDPGLVIAPDGRQAYVIGPGQPVAQVDLQNLTTSRHKVRPALPTINKVETSSMIALSLSDSLIALSGGATTFPLNSKVAPRTRPFGLRLLNTKTWKIRTVDPSVDSAPIAAGNNLIILQFQRAVGFTRDGSRRFIVHDPRFNPNGVAFACGHYFYFQTDDSRVTPEGSQALALDAATGRRAGQTSRSGENIIWLDSPCSDPS
jgi:hypothetical protein